MITEQDIIFDNLYPDISAKLDSILDEVIADIEDDWGIQHSMMMKIVEEWSRKVADRLPLTVEVDEETSKMLKEWENRQ